MPGFVVTLGSTVHCAHGGKATPTVPQPRVRVMGAPVAVMGPPFVVAGCAFPPPPVANGPCVSANFVLAAMRVRAMGMPLILQDSVAVCTPTGAPLTVAFANARVRAM